VEPSVAALPSLGGAGVASPCSPSLFFKSNRIVSSPGRVNPVFSRSVDGPGRELAAGVVVVVVFDLSQVSFPEDASDVLPGGASKLSLRFKSTPSAFAFEPAALSFTAAPPKERSVSVGVDAAKSPNPDALVFVASLGLPGSPVLSCPPYTNSNVSLPITFAPFASRSTVIVCAPPGDIPCGIANGARDLRRSAGCANPATPFTPSVIRRFRSNACAAIDFLRAFSAWVISTVIVTPLTPPPGVSRAAPHTPCAPASSAEVKLKSESAVAVGVGPPAPGGGKFTVGVAPPFETAF
jgi:hypothetical protein